MIYRGQAILLAVTLMTLGTLPVLAQQAPAAGPDAATRAPAADTQPVEKPQEQAKASAGEPDQADEPAASRKDSPFDYRSSEEISEDLSVSFPVDI